MEHTYRIEPGISGENHNATDHKTGAFSSIRSATLKNFWNSAWNSGVFEVGKWW